MTVAVASSAVAVAGAAQAASPPQLVVARVNGDHIGMPNGNTVHSGRVLFKIVSVDGRDHTLQLARLRPGYTVQDFNADAQKIFSGDTDAIRRVDAKVNFKGGADAHHKVGWFSTTVSPGTFKLFDQNGNGRRNLHVVGPRQAASAPAASGKITAFSYGFGTAGRLPAHGWVSLYNQSDQPHFYVFQHVRQSTTHRQVKQFFASGAQGQPSWGLKANTGSGVISPTRAQRLQLDLPAGKYLVACYWPDDDTGMPHAFMGMWKLIQLH